MEPLIVYITGPGRSGSTLLDLLLNQGPYIQSVGEVHRLTLYARTDRETCTCGVSVLDCPFWRDVEREFRRMHGAAPGEMPLKSRELMLIPDRVGFCGAMIQKALLVLGSRRLYRRIAPFVAPAHVEAARNSLRWYDAIRSVSGCPVLVDSTKDARRLKVLYFSRPRSFRVIYMIRDGRAVTASAMRRKGLTMREAAREWRRHHRRTELAIRSMPSGIVLRLRYEELCKQTESTMRTVCSFLGLPFAASMLEVRKHDSHNIGGNPMRFRTGERQVVLDERWRDQLSDSELATFEQIGGRLNRRLGYAAPARS